MRDGNPTSPRLTCKIGQKRPVGKLLQETKMEKKYWISGAVVLAIGVGAFGVANAKKRVFTKIGVGMVEFEDFDANSDGKITKDELENFKKLRFKKADSNGDGMLSEQEISEQAKLIADLIVKQIITRKDSNGDGMLSQAEFSTAHKGMNKFGNKFGKRMFKHMDTDGNGEISAAEFAARKTKWAKRRHGKGATE
ncbi:MAG TPA: calcium-binding protein [Rhodobacteraceae bacterium]|nr:calcium-binding protein [Paracoccaceae bacterium]